MFEKRPPGPNRNRKGGPENRENGTGPFPNRGVREGCKGGKLIRRTELAQWGQEKRHHQRKKEQQVYPAIT